jgi:tRNA threonylcarbamoyladenosine biosynthesis protein TsaB
MEGVFASFHSSRDRRHVETLVPAIDFVCEQARISYDEIGVIAVDNGPGLYTGLRVGMSAAKVMAQALRIPMLSFSSLDLLSFPLRFSKRPIISVIDAKRGEVFYAKYLPVVGGVQRVSEYAVGTAEKLAVELQADQQEVLLVGDGVLRYEKEFSNIENVELTSTEEAFPSASSIVALSQAPAQREDFVQPRDIEPLYLRKSDAEINWEKKNASAG